MYAFIALCLSAAAWWPDVHLVGWWSVDRSTARPWARAERERRVSPADQGLLIRLGWSLGGARIGARAQRSLDPLPTMGAGTVDGRACTDPRSGWPWTGPREPEAAAAAWPLDATESGARAAWATDGAACSVEGSR